jgi:hypothetical protein
MTPTYQPPKRKVRLHSSEDGCGMSDDIAAKGTRRRPCNHTMHSPEGFSQRIAPRGAIYSWSVPDAHPRMHAWTGAARRRPCAQTTEAIPASLPPEGDRELRSNIRQPLPEGFGRGDAPCDASAPNRPKAFRSPKGPRRDLMDISEGHMADITVMSPSRLAFPKERISLEPFSGLRMNPASFQTVRRSALPSKMRVCPEGAAPEGAAFFRTRYIRHAFVS